MSMHKGRLSVERGLVALGEHVNPPRASRMQSMDSKMAQKEALGKTETRAESNTENSKHRSCRGPLVQSFGSVQRRDSLDFVHGEMGEISLMICLHRQPAQEASVPFVYLISS